MLEDIRKCWIVLFLNHFIIYTDVLDTYTNITIKWFSYNWLEWYEKRPSYENITGIIWGSYSFVITSMYQWHDIIILRLFEWSLYDSLSQSNYHLFKPYNSDFYMNQFLDIIMWCKYYLICKKNHICTSYMAVQALISIVCSQNLTLNRRHYVLFIINVILRHIFLIL